MEPTRSRGVARKGDSRCRMDSGQSRCRRARVYRGKEEVRQAFAAIWETWEEFRFEESEIRDLGDTVLWLGRVYASGRASHVELEHDFAIHVMGRDGRFSRAEASLTWQEGIEAAGLSE